MIHCSGVGAEGQWSCNSSSWCVERAGSWCVEWGREGQVDDVMVLERDDPQ